jgi:hypothetical protein
MCEHGQWLPWLKENCPDISARQAQKYMRLSREWSNSPNANQGAHLSINDALALLSLQPDEVTDVEKVSGMPSNRDDILRVTKEPRDESNTFSVAASSGDDSQTTQEQAKTVSQVEDVEEAVGPSPSPQPQNKKEYGFLPHRERERVLKWLTERVAKWPEYLRPTFKNFMQGIIEEITDENN